MQDSVKPPAVGGSASPSIVSVWIGGYCFRRSRLVHTDYFVQLLEAEHPLRTASIDAMEDLMRGVPMWDDGFQRDDWNLDQSRERGAALLWVARPAFSQDDVQALPVSVLSHLAVLTLANLPVCEHGAMARALFVMMEYGLGRRTPWDHLLRANPFPRPVDEVAAHMDAVRALLDRQHNCSLTAFSMPGSDVWADSATMGGSGPRAGGVNGNPGAPRVSDAFRLLISPGHHDQISSASLAEVKQLVLDALCSWVGCDSDLAWRRRLMARVWASPRGRSVMDFWRLRPAGRMVVMAALDVDDRWTLTQQDTFVHQAIQYCHLSSWAKDLSWDNDLFKEVRRRWATGADGLPTGEGSGSDGYAADATSSTGDSEGPSSRPPHLSSEAP